MRFGTRDAPADAQGAPLSDPRDEMLKIDRLLDALATSRAQCVHDGVRTSAAEAADWLRAKLRDAGPAVTSSRAFIEGWATRSSETSDPYLLELGDGRVVQLGAWLTERLGMLERGGIAR